MKKLLFFMIIALPLSLSACSLSVNGGIAASSGRPAIGPTVEKRSVERMEAGQGGDLTIHLANCKIGLTPWDKDYIQASIVERLTGPAGKKALEKLLDTYGIYSEKDVGEITLNVRQPARQKQLSRYEAEIELQIPDRFNRISIGAKSGTIGVSDLKKSKIINLTLDSGSISINGCKAKSLGASLEKGRLYINGYEGSSSIKVGRGDAQISSVEGSLQLDSVSGNTIIENASGKLDCSISAGSLDIKGSRLSQGSVLYASCGDIKVSLTGLDKKGVYDFKTSTGSITLVLPPDAGFQLKSGTGGGRVDSDFTPAGINKSSGSLTSLAGMVGVGGPLLDVFTNNGNIKIRNSPG